MIDLIATSAFGLESIVALELKKLGYTDLCTENGRVSFKAELNAIPRCNFWLRTADRLLLKIGSFTALSFEELFEKTKALPWTDWLPENARFPVEGKSIQSQLYSISDCQAIVKKAIVEKMKEKYHRQWFSETGPLYKIEVSLLNNTAVLTIDTSGPGLHKRGYRQLSAEAPLKETLAAAMIMISRWKPDRAFIDPFCGSGTIPIEAALIGLNIAPGINRDFAASQWVNINPKIWETSRQEARDLINKHQSLGIFGSDIDQKVLELARYHARQAGVDKHISFSRQDATTLNSRYNYGYLIANPPYGERLAEKASVKELYRSMQVVFNNLNTWSFYILTSHQNFEKLIAKKADKRRKLYNGRIQCTYYQFFGPRPENLAGPFSIR